MTLGKLIISLSFSFPWDINDYLEGNSVVRVKFRNTFIEHLLFAVYLVLLGGKKKKKRIIQRGSLTQWLLPLVLTTREPQKARKLEGFNLQLVPCWVVVTEGHSSWRSSPHGLLSLQGYSSHSCLSGLEVIKQPNVISPWGYLWFF